MIVLLIFCMEGRGEHSYTLKETIPGRDRKVSGIDGDEG